MSYLITEYRAPLKVDFINQLNRSGNFITFTLPSSYNTNITATSNSFTLYSGSSYYLEASVRADNPSQNGAVNFQFYSSTDAALIGQGAQMNFASGLAGVARVGRRVCSALVLDSSISTSKTIQLQALVTSTNWTFSVPFGSWTGYPTIRIIQLPS